MTVQQLIDLLQTRYPADAEVWYMEEFHGMLQREVKESDIKMEDGKVVIGYV